MIDRFDQDRMRDQQRGTRWRPRSASERACSAPAERARRRRGRAPRPPRDRRHGRAAVAAAIAAAARVADRAPARPATPRAVRPAPSGRRRCGVGLQLPSFSFPGGPAAIRPTPDRDRAGGRGERVRQPVGDGPPLPAARGHRAGAARRADARGVHDARLPGRATEPDRARPDGRRCRLPPARPLVKAATTLDVLAGGRTVLRRSAPAGTSARRAAGPPMAAARRAVRAAGGDAPDRPRDVGRRRRADRGRHTRRRADLPPARCRSPAADHDRRRRGAPDAAPRRRVRRRRATSSSPIPARARTSSRSCAGTARRSAATSRRSRRRRSSRPTSDPVVSARPTS